MQTTDQQFAKLPRYAQDDLRFLQRRVADLEQTLANMATPAQPETRIFHGRTLDDLRFPIPTGHSVIFIMPDGLRCRVRLDGPAVRVMGDERIEIAPISPNVVLLLPGRSTRTQP